VTNIIPQNDAEQKSDLDERLLMPFEVAKLFRVDPTTVVRWTRAGRLRSVRTPGGQHRYRESEVQALLMEAVA
jgi:excisionase family DNA binding protein